ncbi:hypothetical protein A5662_25390 [Mycobacteriaceae bacterium 1482268.1]|nr:hypothetical protein A5662_25390 [Mycobacteriaceae bacterium 1482268.1]
MSIPNDWAPEACTLPTTERPLRVAEFDALLAAASTFERRDPTQLVLTLPADLELAARDLAARERRCCGFFTFDFVSDGECVLMRISVPPAQAEVLDALATRIAR